MKLSGFILAWLLLALPAYSHDIAEVTPCPQLPENSGLHWHFQPPNPDAAYCTAMRGEVVVIGVYFGNFPWFNPLTACEGETFQVGIGSTKFDCVRPKSLGASKIGGQEVQWYQALTRKQKSDEGMTISRQAVMAAKLLLDGKETGGANYMLLTVGAKDEVEFASILAILEKMHVSKEYADVLIFTQQYKDELKTKAETYCPLMPENSGLVWEYEPDRHGYKCHAMRADKIKKNATRSPHDWFDAKVYDFIFFDILHNHTINNAVATSQIGDQMVNWYQDKNGRGEAYRRAVMAREQQPGKGGTKLSYLVVYVSGKSEAEIQERAVALSAFKLRDVSYKDISAFDKTTTPQATLKP